MADQSGIQAKLKVLRDGYAAQLPDKIDQIAQTWSQLSESEWSEEGFQVLHRMVHSLAGSGKTFGFSVLSDIARKLENQLKQIGIAKIPPDNEQRVQVENWLIELRRASVQRDDEVGDQSGMNGVASLAHSSGNSRQIFVVEDDRDLADSLKVLLNYFGYEVSVFHALEDFSNAVQKNPNAIILMDVNFPGDDRGGLRVMSELQLEREVKLPVIFISAHNGMDVRLEAVRAGCAAYMTKPLDFGMLIDKLDILSFDREDEAYRVLLVDDDVNITNYATAILEEAGLTTRAVNDPLLALDALFEFSPDLILLDIYMPGCHGMEVAKVIRQIDAYIGIPIVFLTDERDPDVRISAVGLGVDDFLEKPITAKHLLSSVSSRIKRSLVLRSLMVRDSLTGLLNHTAIKSRLSSEIVRAKRQGTPLSFVMVDIDHFKVVNDTYGHPAGDRVIKSLARLLKQRLRETDFVGRYGGEEFAAILVDTDGAAAMKIFDAIRNDFSRLNHVADDHEFSATFSCGISDISKDSDPSKLTIAADRALYRAKHAGRNQVVVDDVAS